MNNTINIEDISFEHRESFSKNQKAAIKDIVEQALNLASENAGILSHTESDGYECWEVSEIDKNSILNVKNLIIY